MSRSEFFARAAVSYLKELDEHSLTSQIDAALDVCGVSDDSGRTAVDAGRALLSDSDEQW